MQLYDDQGNQVDGALAPEDAKALQDKFSSYESEKNTLLKTLEERELKLKGLENKDLNFKRFRDLTAEEKTKMSSETLALKAEVEDLRTTLESTNKQNEETLKETKSSLLDQLSMSDSNMKDKIEYEIGQLNMPEGSAKEIHAKYLKAYKLVTGNTAAPNPLNTGIPSGGGYTPPSSGGKEFGTSQDGLDLAKKLGLSYVKKFEKK